MTSDQHAEATEAALVIATLVRDPTLVSDSVAATLKRLLGHTLAAPPREALRWDNLQLVVKLITERDGRLPTVAEYEDARIQRQLATPSATALLSRYGSWLRVNHIAIKLAAATEAYRGPEHTPPKPLYRPVECAIALVKFHQAFGTWPATEEYRLWARISKQAARHCGASDPRLPDSPTIVRHYGTFDRAIAAARDFERGCGDSDTGSVPSDHARPAFPPDRRCEDDIQKQLANEYREAGD